MLWGVKFFITTVQKKISPSPFPTALTRPSRAAYNRSKDNKCTAGVEGQFIPRLRSSVPGHLSARKSRFPLMPCKTRNKIYHYSISIAHSNVKNWEMHRSLFHLTLLLQRTLRGIFSFFSPFQCYPGPKASSTRATSYDNFYHAILICLADEENEKFFMWQIYLLKSWCIVTYEKSLV